jgi:hypothetical protein
VASRLLEVLINAGYPDQAWFVLVGHDERPRGAAVFTSLEVINEEGNRASVPYEPSEFHKLIFGAPAQHVRRFAFYLSDLPLTSMPQPEVTPDTLDTPFSNGARTPAFPELETINASHYELVAYVYVFKKSPLTGELTLIREASGNLLNAKAHLTAAGLWRALGYSD